MSDRLKESQRSTKRNASNVPLVLYHANCPDGFTAAWCAYRRFRSDDGAYDGADYVPVNYGDPAPDATEREVYMVDFSYPQDVLINMAREARSITILDHHQTAKQHLEGFSRPNIAIHFDLNKSGARLAWEFFHPKEDPPWIVKYVEDRDLWRFKLLHSREVNDAIHSYPQKFSRWDAWAYNPEQEKIFKNLVVEGAAISRYKDKLVESICAQAREIEMDSYPILAANTPVLQSEVAGRLANGRAFGAVWWLGEDAKVRWSLRSDKNGVDVSTVASLRGGGGHPHAAGFTVED